MQVVYLTFFPEKRVKEKYDTHMRTEGTLSSLLKVPPDLPICRKPEYKLGPRGHTAFMINHLVLINLI